MKSFTKTGAQHFVGSFGANPLVAALGVEDFLTSVGSRAIVFDEGTPRFNELRDCVLRDADRSILLSVNCFARALDGLRASSVYWTLVGLYYASFYAAKGILGMYGCWMSRPRMWIEVVDSNPGKQRLAFRTSTYGKGGSHQVTWTAFYSAMSPLLSWLVTPHAHLAATPVNSLNTWLIDARNEVNYDPAKAFKMKQEFDAEFDPAKIPTCFGGKFRTMFEISHAFVLFAREMSKDLGLKTDIQAPQATREDWCRTHITSAQDPVFMVFSKSHYLSLEF